VISSIGLSTTHKYSVYKLQDSEYLKALNYLKTSDILPRNDYIIVHPFSGWKFRNWKISNYVKIIQNIIETFDIEVVVIASKEEEKDILIAKEKFGKDKRVKFAIGLNLDYVSALIKNSILFIGNDSGPVHLASALGVKVIGIFGPSPPEITGPLKNNNIFLYKKVECSPCNQIKCIRPQYNCLDIITVNEVFSVVGECLRKYRKSSTNGNEQQNRIAGSKNISNIFK
jgi:ADP-heptose:LPS heptosyltransferase